MSQTDLYTEFQLGPSRLKNRFVMAPMTRNRADENLVPTDLMATYYAQRASAGLLVTEATQVTPEGQGYPRTPGIYNAAQVEGWSKITSAVHAAGGRIFLQLWHVGRISHPVFQPNGAKPVSASAVKPAGQVFTGQGMADFETPRALDLSEIPGVVEQFRRGAQNALEAGFDGVEIHGANGYLIDQFLRDGTNQRTDAYGGSIQNRVRFLKEVTEAVVGVWGPARVGVRLSPSNTFNDMKDSTPLETFSEAVRVLDALGVVYVHLLEGSAADLRHGGLHVPTAPLRKLFKNALIVNSGYTRERADNVLAGNEADLIAFGQWFLANPDLPERLRTGAPLNAPDIGSFYGGTEKGYTDYPTLSETAGAR
jgi:N-ethylmaleimide reductase